MKNFISISTCSPEELKELLAESAALKKFYKSGKRDTCLAGKNIVMLFEKPSLRTRMSFEVAMNDLGGSPIYINDNIGKREPVKDMARVLSRYVDSIVARTFEHSTVIELADFASVPVINALTDWCHPCQAMADVMTIAEHFKKLQGLKVAFIGDGNNVARSLAYACAKLDMKMVIASPPDYQLDAESIVAMNRISPTSITQINDPLKAVADADVIYTDTWISMGQEDEKQKRIADFKNFQIDSDMLNAAPSHAKIMHCLPAYRGLEISDEAIESKNSIIFDQSENRLHFQRNLLKKLIS
jgi:ornithine carbamoyltransferase